MYGTSWDAGAFGQQQQPPQPQQQQLPPEQLHLLQQQQQQQQQQQHHPQQADYYFEAHQQHPSLQQHQAYVGPSSLRSKPGYAQHAVPAAGTFEDRSSRALQQQQYAMPPSSLGLDPGARPEPGMDFGLGYQPDFAAYSNAMAAPQTQHGFAQPGFDRFAGLAPDGDGQQQQQQRYGLQDARLQPRQVNAVQQGRPATNVFGGHADASSWAESWSDVSGMSQSGSAHQFASSSSSSSSLGAPQRLQGPPMQSSGYGDSPQAGPSRPQPMRASSSSSAVPQVYHFEAHNGAPFPAQMDASTGPSFNHQANGTASMNAHAPLLGAPQSLGAGLSSQPSASPSSSGAARFDVSPSSSSLSGAFSQRTSRSGSQSGTSAGLTAFTPSRNEPLRRGVKPGEANGMLLQGLGVQAGPRISAGPAASEPRGMPSHYSSPDRRTRVLQSGSGESQWHSLGPNAGAGNLHWVDIARQHAPGIDDGLSAVSNGSDAQRELSYADHALAASMAAGAHISAGHGQRERAGSGAGMGPSVGGSSTPTIMEEDEPLLSFQQQPGFDVAPQQQRQLQQQQPDPRPDRQSIFQLGPSAYHGLGLEGSQMHSQMQHMPTPQQQQANAPAFARSTSDQTHVISQQQLQQQQQGHFSSPGGCHAALPHQRDDGAKHGSGAAAGRDRASSDATPTASTEVQRPYRPVVRPSTFLQASFLRMGDEANSTTPGGSQTEPADCTSFIRRPLENYLTAVSRLGLGERTVLIMTSKVAQKSYGVEKRFLCPPPMVLLIGSSWWSACKNDVPAPFGFIEGQSDQAPTSLAPPRLQIAISGETHSQEGALEWGSSSGRLIDVGNPSSEMAISGRCIGRQLYITDLDEKRRYCEAVVNISVPGNTVSERHLLGSFASKPIKVISKPSKKRQSSRNADLCVNHGTTISLFHRLRSQTVSTRYLCVSGAPTWFKGSDGQPFVTPAQDAYLPDRLDPPSQFVAKMSSWDPFVIYLVDPTKSSDASTDSDLPPPVPGYPPPPSNALPCSPQGSAATPIYYNQPVVLQCLHTAVVSPIMVIRRVDKGTTVMGGSQAPPGVHGTPIASREAPGDPVSQLHKIALEVLEDASAPAPVASARGAMGELLPPGQSGPFLACLNESVGMRKPDEPRRWVPNAGCSTPSTPLTPMIFPAPDVTHLEDSKMHALGTPPTSPMSMAAAYAAAQTQHSLQQARHYSTVPSGSTSGSSSAGGAMEPPPSSDGGKVKRPRRVSSSVVHQQKERLAANTAAAKNRRRGQSMSTVAQMQQLAASASSAAHVPASGLETEMLRRTGSFAHSISNSESSTGGVPLSATWSVDVSDSDVWTIVGTDVARHTFYIPPRIIGGSRPKAPAMDSSVTHLITVPAPRTSLSPLPVLTSFIAANASSEVTGAMTSRGTATTAVFGGEADGGNAATANAAQSEGGTNFVTIFGENFSKDLFVYFGDWRSEQVEVQSSSTILCAPPPAIDPESGTARGKVPILFVRHDGIVFPTNSYYTAR